MPDFEVHRLSGGRSYTLAHPPCPTLAKAKRLVYWDDPAYILDRETGRIVAFAEERDNVRRTWRTCDRAMTNRSLRDLFGTARPRRPGVEYALLS